MTYSSGSGSISLERSVRDTIIAIQQWVSNPKSVSCGSVSNTDELCSKSNSGESFRVRSTQRRTSTRTPTILFNLAGLEESKYSDDSPFMSAVQCSGKDNLNFNMGSDDGSTSEEDDQMRRLGSWGTFGTVGTNESLDMIIEGRKVDDDGNPINPQILEKTKLNRAKLQSGMVKRRAVKFAYPPISSLKQCPRIDPDEVDLLFFSDEELETYENDRRSTGTVDDVEIVAVSTSFSDEVPVPPQTQVLPTVPTTHVTSPQRASFAKLLLSPKTRKALAEHQESQCHQENRDVKLKRGSTYISPKTRIAPDENSSRVFSHQTDEMDQPKEKRLLKSVQIFLRARSTA
jgi:hypothetical protein